MRYLCLLFGLLLVSCATAEKSDWKPLFDGETLEGWEALPGGEWSVVDGAIAGTCGKKVIIVELPRLRWEVIC